MTPPLDPRTARLAGVHPDLVQKILTVLQTLAKAGRPMFVAQGVRTIEEQQALYARGRTVKGPIVTNCDGVQMRSRHQPQSDGFGHAVDCAFVDSQPFSDVHPWTLYGDVAKDQGLIWGGDWTTFPDRPHVELPRSVGVPV